MQVWGKTSSVESSDLPIFEENRIAVSGIGKIDSDINSG
jgi:hypothetical protein